MINKTHADALNSLSEHVWGVAQSKGFKDSPVPVGDSVANLHGEVSELWEAYRAQKLDAPCDKATKMAEHGIPVLTCQEEELADIIIRALDTARDRGIDIGRAVLAKDAYNQTRAYRNGGKIA